MNRLTLTASSMSCALRCPRRCWYDNVLGLKEAKASEALRIGTAVHGGGEARARGLDFGGQYAAALEGGALDEWTAAKVFGILGAYDRTYGEVEDRDCAAMEPEVEFTDPIDGSRTFAQRGKVDGLAVLRDGRRVVWERKTTSDDLSDTSGYWERLRFNVQLLAYAEGRRCVKRDGTQKRTADAAKGERVAGHPETPDEYGARILEAMSSKPSRYFARREVAVTEDMLAEFRRERLGVCRMLLHFAAEARRSERPEYAWPRACNPDNCRACPFAGFCLNRVPVDAEHVPDGFRIALHEELSRPQGAAVA